LGINNTLNCYSQQKEKTGNQVREIHESPSKPNFPFTKGESIMAFNEEIYLAQTPAAREAIANGLFTTALEYYSVIILLTLKNALKTQDCL
jgi:hypothetical protein